MISRFDSSFSDDDSGTVSIKHNEWNVNANENGDVSVVGELCVSFTYTYKWTREQRCVAVCHRTINYWLWQINLDLRNTNAAIFICLCIYKYWKKMCNRMLTVLSTNDLWICVHDIFRSIELDRGRMIFIWNKICVKQYRGREKQKNTWTSCK